MAEGVIATGRRYLSDVLKGYTMFEDDAATNYCFATVDLELTAALDDVMGLPIIWNDADDVFNVFVAQDPTAVADVTTLPNGAPIAVVVGTKEGRGFNKEGLPIGTSPVTVVFRGPASVVDTVDPTAGATTLDGPFGGIYWKGSLAADRAAFNLQMEVQGVAVMNTTEKVDPNFVS